MAETSAATSSSIRLVIDAPPDGASWQTIGSMRRLDARGEQLGEARLLSDPFLPEQRALLRWYFLQFPRWPFGGFTERAERAASAMVGVGRELYRSAFGEEPAAGLREVRVETSNAAAHSLPWELLHDGSAFLSLRGENPVSIVRRIPVAANDGAAGGAGAPLRVLLVTARPSNAERVDRRIVARGLFERLEPAIAAGMVALEFLWPPTIAALERRLRAMPAVHVVHFDGHGQAGGESAAPALLFEDDRFLADEVPAQRFARAVAAGSVPVAVLTACETAAASGANDIGSTAQALAEAGVAAVVAMSDMVRVDTAAHYADALYHAIAEGQAVPDAHDSARRSLARRAAFSADWSTPQLFLERDVVPLAVPARGAASAPPAATEDGKRFAGRSDALLGIERGARNGRPVALRGFGGIGKTALAREASRWLVRTGFAPSSEFIACGGTLVPDLVARLEALERDAAARDARPVVILDAIDEVAFGFDTREEETDRLCEALAALSRQCSLVVTMRDLSDNTGLLDPTRGWVDVQVGPLDPDDALELAGDVLREKGVDPLRFERQALERVLRLLGSSPLGIESVAGELQGSAPQAVTERLERNLPPALRASLEKSLERLTPDERTLLGGFAPFAGCGNFRSLRRVTALEPKTFDALVVSLRRAGLARFQTLTNTEKGNLPFLLLDPSLGPYLRELGDDAVPAERYVEEYDGISQLLFLDPTPKDPTLAARLYDRERPNLERALELSGRLWDAARVAEFRDRVASLAGRFGGHLDAFSIDRVATAGPEELAAAREALRALEAAPQPDQVEIGKAETILGIALQRAGEPDEARAVLEAATKRFDAPSAAHAPELVIQYELAALAGLGSVLHQQQRYEQAREAYGRWLTTGTVGGTYLDPAGAAAAHLELGSIARHLDRWDEAEKAYEKSFAIAKTIAGTHAERAGALFGLAAVAMHAKNWDAAERCLLQAIDACRQAGDARRITSAYSSLAEIAVQRNDFTEARRWFQAIVESDGYAAFDAETRGFTDQNIAFQYYSMALVRLGSDAAVTKATTPEAFQAACNAYLARDAETKAWLDTAYGYASAVVRALEARTDSRASALAKGVLERIAQLAGPRRD